MVGSLADLSAFMEKQQHMMNDERESMESKMERMVAKMEHREAKMEQQRQETKAKLEQQEAKIEQQRQDTEQQRQYTEAKMEQQRQETERQRQANATLREQALLREQTQIAALQLRVQAMHAAQLLTDDELYSLEDIIADGCESAADGEEGDDRVTVGKMIALSERMAADGAFSRQLRRKFAQ